MRFALHRAALAFAAAGIMAMGLGTAAASNKPDKLNIGITAFLSGPASVFGQPARVAAEMIAERINADGGIHGVPLSLTFVDEGAGGEHVLSEYRRLVQSEGYNVMFAAISSGNCQSIAPLAEDMKVLNLMWECGTQRIFEQGQYRYVFRPQAYATSDMVASVLYLLKTRPDFKTIAVVNQDYAWGRDSWNMFLTALKAMKTDVEVVGEFFPAFGTADYSTEISRLLAARPDVILSTSWGGDLETFVRQSSQRGLTKTSTFVLPLAVSSLQQLGSALGEGHIVGARGDNYFLHPEKVDEPEFRAFVDAYKEKTGNYPIHTVFHISQAFRALQAAYDKAIEANGGEWPEHEQVVDAMSGLTFTGLTRPVTIRKDGQALEDQLLGTTISVEAYDFPVLDNMMIFDAEAVTTPIGQTSSEWLKSLSPDFVESVSADSFSYREAD